MPTVARVLNFAILAGVLFYFLRVPAAAYLAGRSTQIRQDLVTAAEMRAAATAQLAQIQEKMQSLPAELDALRAQGAEDVVAERGRISRAAAIERDRLLEHTRREIDMQLRVARRGLVEHAAQLAVDVARARIVRTITPEDQLRLVDRYAAQLKEAQ
jgi:F-type H+-transporting ATPase subunit b